jgi:hypothetical protein
VRSLTDIHDEIDVLTERRLEVLNELSHGHDSALVAEHQRLEDEIARLWDEHRHARAQLRFGERDKIIQRARAEERLERAA